METVCVVFNGTNPNWQASMEMNGIFLQMQQNFFNQSLHSRGHVFLNEIFDALGFHRTSYGQTHGWTVDGEQGYIEFVTVKFDNSISIAFHTEGNILDKIDQPIKE